MSSSSCRTGLKRNPKNCEPCRARKLRCSRDGRPCKPCEIRGLGATDCIYLGQPRLPPKQPSSANSALHKALLARITDLEAQLQKQTSIQARYNSESASSPPTALMASKSLDEFMNESNGNGPMSEYAGALHTSPLGYVRYTSSASWQSVIVNSPWTGLLQSFTSDVNDEDDLQIPLTWNAHASHAELLGMLPPVGYCNALKELFFRAISPVSISSAL